jgi:acyl dehydratase
MPWGTEPEQSVIGRSYPPTAPYTVDREEIHEFATAVGDPNPAYTDTETARALGHPDVIAPPTFVFTITSAAENRIIEDPRLDLDHSVVMHGAQKFVYSRPVRAGDRLTVTSTLRSVRSLAGNDVLEIHNDVHDDADEHVATTITTLLMRHASPPNQT